MQCSSAQHLEGAGVLGGDDVAHLVHHVAETLHLLRVAEALRGAQCARTVTARPYKQAPSTLLPYSA